MNELHAILDVWREQQSSSRDAVLATVVHVRGSAYRRPGARMLILADGRRVGSVSGGCLESEIVRRAQWLTERGVPVVRAYDTTSSNDGVWEFGLGCNGVVQILLERADATSAAELLGFLSAHRESRQPATVATVIRTDHTSPVRVGDRLLLGDTWKGVGALVGSSIEDDVRAHASEVLRTSTNRLVHLGGDEVFIEWIGPPLSLVVFGAGDDAMPVATMAKQLGWCVSIADGRPAYAARERFPTADRVVAMAAGEPLRGIDIHPGTAVVLMTHNYPLDARLLPLIVARCPWYLGLLGPRSRAEALFADLALEVPRSVHAPVGLDLGGDIPQAVALSIVAEIQAAANRRPGGKLTLRGETIHPPAIEVGARALHRENEPVHQTGCLVRSFSELP